MHRESEWFVQRVSWMWLNLSIVPHFAHLMTPHFPICAPPPPYGAGVPPVHHVCVQMQMPLHSSAQQAPLFPALRLQSQLSGWSSWAPAQPELLARLYDSCSFCVLHCSTLRSALADGDPKDRRHRGVTWNTRTFSLDVLSISKEVL